MRPPVTTVLPQSQQQQQNNIHQIIPVDVTMSQVTISTTTIAPSTTTTTTSATMSTSSTVQPLSPILLTNDNNRQNLLKVLTNSGRTLLTTNNSVNIIPLQPIVTPSPPPTTTIQNINQPIIQQQQQTLFNDNFTTIASKNDLISCNNSVLLHYHHKDKDNLVVKKQQQQQQQQHQQHQQQQQSQLTLNDNNCCNTILNDNLSDILSENLSDINNKKHNNNINNNNTDCNVFKICNNNHNTNTTIVKKINSKRNNEKLLVKNNNNNRLSNNNNNNSVVKKLKRHSSDGVCLLKPIITTTTTTTNKKLTSDLPILTVNNSIPKHKQNHNHTLNYKNIIINDNNDDNLEKIPLLCSPSISPTPPSSPPIIQQSVLTTPLMQPPIITPITNDNNLINLKKQNNTTLIFTKKQQFSTINNDCDYLLKSGKRYRINKVKDKQLQQLQQQQQQKQKRHSYHHTFSVTPINKTDDITTATTTTDTLTEFLLNSSTDDRNNTTIKPSKIDEVNLRTSRQICHSWYGGNGTAYDILFEELDHHLPVDLLDHNLAGSRQNVSNGTRESVSLLEPDNQTVVQQTRLKRTSDVCIAAQQSHLVVSSGGNGGSTNEISAHPPSLVTQTPRLRRFEQLLKTLIGGKKASKDATTSPPLLPTKQSNANTTIATATATTNPPLVDNNKKITKTTSEHSLSAHGCTQKSNNHHSHHRLNVSTTSLNSVHQKLWTVLPLLKREGSCASLSHTKATPVAEYSGMRKCETVLALTHSTTSNSLNLPTRHQLQHQHSLQHNPYHHHSQQHTPATTPTSSEPIKPLNRLRNCASIATCSRCSSLLSLAATAGSRYSLNVSSGGFVVVNGASGSNDSKNSDVLNGGVGGGCSSGSSGSSGISGCGIDDDDDFLLSKITTKTKVSGQQLPPTLITPPTPTPTPPPLPPIIILSEEYEQPITLIQQYACKLCLAEVKIEQLTKIAQCGCTFCTECMNAYVEFEILEGAYEISCPDAMCPAQGILTLNEIQKLSSTSLMEKHQRYRLNREVELDKNRTWCPKAGCETICTLQPSKMITTSMFIGGGGGGGGAAGGPSSSSSSVALNIEKSLAMKLSASSNDMTMTAAAAGTSTILQAACAVHCPTCFEDFCSGCKKTWHPTMSCEENTRRLAAAGNDDSFGIPFDSDLIKCCPMCAVPIEKDEGCAQMMCKRCKHVFCWYCLASLDDDFLLRHYDKGPCKNKLGHSRASVVWHRAQVIGIFAGFGILLLVASPLLLLAAPCIVCCKCRICNGAARLEENDGDFDEGVALHR